MSNWPPTESDPAVTDYPRTPCCGRVIVGNQRDGFYCIECGTDYELYYKRTTAATQTND